jgi:lipid A 4'-phosphatase
MTKSFFRIALAALLLLILVTGGVFYTHPEWDKAASAAFYDTETATFPAKFTQPYRFANEAVDIMAKIVAVLALGSLLYYIIFRKRWSVLPPYEALFIIVVLAVAPGLVVNTVFKDNWGRARPSQTTDFGGVRSFSPVWVVSDQCAKNCSFPSGDASMGFFLLAFAAVSRFRVAWLSAGLIMGGVFGYVRIAQGAHYLSDVLHSGLFVALVTLILARLFRLPLRRLAVF